MAHEPSQRGGAEKIPEIQVNITPTEGPPIENDFYQGIPLPPTNVLIAGLRYSLPLMDFNDNLKLQKQWEEMAELIAQQGSRINTLESTLASRETEKAPPASGFGAFGMAEWRRPPSSVLSTHSPVASTSSGASSSTSSHSKSSSSLSSSSSASSDSLSTNTSVNLPMSNMPKMPAVQIQCTNIPVLGWSHVPLGPNDHRLIGMGCPPWKLGSWMHDPESHTTGKITLKVNSDRGNGFLFVTKEGISRILIGQAAWKLGYARHTPLLPKRLKVRLHRLPIRKGRSTGCVRRVNYKPKRAAPQSCNDDPSTIWFSRTAVSRPPIPVGAYQFDPHKNMDCFIHGKVNTPEGKGFLVEYRDRSVRVLIKKRA